MYSETVQDTQELTEIPWVHTSLMYIRPVWKVPCEGSDDRGGLKGALLSWAALWHAVKGEAEGGSSEAAWIVNSHACEADGT